MKEFFRYKRILIVEDDFDFQRVVSDCFLRRYGFDIEIDVAEFAAEAFLKIAACSGCYDLVILDHRLKGSSSGFFLYREIDKKYPQIPVIMCSGTSVQEFVGITRKQKKVPKFLSKPFSMRDFESVLRNIYLEKSEGYKLAG